MGTSPDEPRLTPLADALADFMARTEGRETSIGALLDALGEKGTAVLLILLAAPFVLPLPLPGLSMPFGAALAFLGVRVALGKPPLLPGFLLRRPIKPSTLSAVVRSVGRVATPIERWLRPRLLLLFNPLAHLGIGIGITLAAILLIPPFPMPGINALPSLAIVLFGLGLMERDGVAIAFGALILLVSYAYLFLWWDVAVRVLGQLPLFS
jgi:hypothetical protein